MRQLTDSLNLQRLNEDSALALWDESCCLLFDPWMEGPQVDLASWFSQQSLKTYEPGLPLAWNGKYHIAITHQFTDHCHPVTLKKLKSSTLEQVNLYKLRQGQEGIQIGSFLINRYGMRLLHSLYEIIHTPTGKRVLLSPHGFRPNAGKCVPAPGADLWLTTSQEYALPWFLGGTVNLGADALIELAAVLQPKKLTEIHQASKLTGGIVARLAKVTLTEYDRLQNQLAALTKPVELISLPPGKTYCLI